ncbi:MAG: hypothetical protein ACK47R_16880, partial [Planctomycetia bacterium]
LTYCGLFRGQITGRVSAPVVFIFHALTGRLRTPLMITPMHKHYFSLFLAGRGWGVGRLFLVNTIRALTHPACKILKVWETFPVARLSQLFQR